MSNTTRDFQRDKGPRPPRYTKKRHGEMKNLTRYANCFEEEDDDDFSDINPDFDIPEDIDLNQ